MTEQPTDRIDRVTAEGFLDGLADASAATVRAMRDDCRAEEARLSYARRLLHGQLDVARAELARRSDGGGDLEALVTGLGAILADSPSGSPRPAVNAEVYQPTDDADDVLDGLPLAMVPDLDDEALVAAVEALQAREQEVSRLRRTVLDHLDRLQDELVDRYRGGSTSIDDVVAPAVE